MNNTTNIIFSFLGGVAVGALATFGVLKKTGKLVPTENDILSVDPSAGTDASVDSSVPQSDKPSFNSPKTIDTKKTAYDGVVTKPALEDLAKRYEDSEVEPTVIKEAAEREYPEDDDPTEEELEEQELQDEIGAALIEREYTDGYGHVIRQLTSKRRDNEVYLVHEEDAGEIYALEDLTYYAGDDVLCDVTDTPVDDVDRIIGDALKYFGECGDDPDVIYVRNCTSEFEYEITRVDGYYGAKIYGVSDEELKATLKNARSRKETKDDE